MVIHDYDNSNIFSHLQNDLPEPLEISQTMNLQENPAQPKVNLKELSHVQRVNTVLLNDGGASQEVCRLQN